MDFPQYRELVGFNRFYKIVDERNFIEIYFMGSKKVENHIEAKQYPEMLRIKDLLSCESPFEIMNESSFLEKTNY
jgi:hypothetical protein